MDYGERAKENFQSGYSCAQAVFLACTEDMGLDTETRARIASSFGGGMGGMRQVCGAVSGMLMALGLKYGYADPKDRAGKTAQYELVRALADEFKKENGSIICRELLGLDENFKPKPPRRARKGITKSVRAVNCAGRRPRFSSNTKKRAGKPKCKRRGQLYENQTLEGRIGACRGSKI